MGIRLFHTVTLVIVRLGVCRWACSSAGVCVDHSHSDQHSVNCSKNEVNLHVANVQQQPCSHANGTLVVLYINLASSKLRRQRVEAHIRLAQARAHFGMQVHVIRVEAVDASVAKIPVHIAVIQSHLRAIRAARDYMQEHALARYSLILEDDATFELAPFWEHDLCSFVVSSFVVCVWVDVGSWVCVGFVQSYSVANAFCCSLETRAAAFL